MSPDIQWRPKASPWAIAGSVVLATFMQVLDTTIVSVALPYMAGSLAATNEEATWVLTSYLVANAIVLPASGWLALRFGRKRLLMGCTAFFTLASFFCGIAPSMPFLILARILQGASGGALQPLAQAILLETFPPAKRGMAMALFGVVIVVAPVIGPTLGRWLTDNYNWRWVFNINIPVGVLAIFLMGRNVEDPPYITHAKRSTIDAAGFASLILWLGTLQIVLDKGQQEDWFETAWIAWFMVTSIAAMIAFIFRELRTREPVVELRVFRDRNFAVGTFLTALVGAGMFSSITMLPLFLQTLLGYTAQASGLATTPRGLGSLVAMPLVGTLIAMRNIIFANVIQGLGIACLMVPLLTLSMATLRNEQMGNATSLFNPMRNLGGSIGIALAIAYLARGAQAHQAMMVSHLTPYDFPYQQRLSAIQAGLTPLTGAPQAQRQAYAALQGIVLQQAHLRAFLDNFRWIALGIAACAPIVLLMKKSVARRRPAPQQAEL